VNKAEKQTLRRSRYIWWGW